MTPRASQTASIDAYISAFPSEVQAILRRVRDTIVRAAPEAEETISYRMPSFVLDGPLVYFGGFQEHVGFYPPVRDASLIIEAAPYANARGNLRFRYDEPVPYALISKLVEARVAENRAKAASKARRPRRRTHEG